MLLMAASTALLLTVQVSDVAGYASCFKDYANGRLYKAKYGVCSGEMPIEVMNVSLSAPNDRRVGRHIFWRNHQVGPLIFLFYLRLSKLPQVKAMLLLFFIHSTGEVAYSDTGYSDTL